MCPPAMVKPVRTDPITMMIPTMTSMVDVPPKGSVRSLSETLSQSPDAPESVTALRAETPRGIRLIVGSRQNLPVIRSAKTRRTLISPQNRYNQSSHSIQTGARFSSSGNESPCSGMARDVQLIPVNSGTHRCEATADVRRNINVKVFNTFCRVECDAISTRMMNCFVAAHPCRQRQCKP